MRPDRATEQTRADVARRRLAQLAASFDAELPPAVAPETTSRRFDAPHVRVLITLAVAGGVLLVWWLLSGRPQTTEPDAPLAFPGTSGAPASAEASAVQKPADDLVIDVVGKVRQPGIVSVPKGSRVYQAIEAAGGLRGKVDTATLNMARVLTDGEQVLVGVEPVALPAGAPGASTGAGGVAQAKINLNSATAEQLDTLPGVGPVTAQAILSWRAKNGRFGAVDDLLDVKGIGEATLAELRDLLTV